MANDLYAATVTSVPLLLLALVADSTVFGPGVRGRHRPHRRWDAFLDVFMLLALGVGFFAALIGLTMQDPPDLRVPAAYGLGFGAAAAFLHAVVRVLTLYRDAER